MCQGETGNIDCFMVELRGFLWAIMLYAAIFTFQRPMAKPEIYHRFAESEIKLNYTF